MKQRAHTDSVNALLKSQLVQVHEDSLRMAAFVESRLQDVSYLGRTALQAAYATQYVMNRFPRLAVAGKRLRRWVERNVAALHSRNAA